jgi:KDO2-lipid IV(A) lauroyltransferase
MANRSFVRNAVEFAAAMAVLKPLEWAPLPAARALSGAYARLLDLGIPRLRRVAMRNLEMAMPNLPNPERRKIADGVFASIARIGLSAARFPSIHRGNLSEWIRCEGSEHFHGALRAGRGVLFATAHLGNWELSAFAHALLEKPMNVVVRPFDNPAVDRVVEARRALSGNRILSKRQLARPILRALEANEAVGILIDQNAAADEGIFVDFFGIPACTSAAFVKLAARSGAAVVPGFALWAPEERRYVLRFYPPIPITGDAALDTQVVQAQLESVIRAHPDQWLWIHRRWKTRPPGEASLY